MNKCLQFAVATQFFFVFSFYLIHSYYLYISKSELGGDSASVGVERRWGFESVLDASLKSVSVLHFLFDWGVLSVALVWELWVCLITNSVFNHAQSSVKHVKCSDPILALHFPTLHLLQSSAKSCAMLWLNHLQTCGEDIMGHSWTPWVIVWMHRLQTCAEAQWLRCDAALAQDCPISFPDPIVCGPQVSRRRNLHWGVWVCAWCFSKECECVTFPFWLGRFECGSCLGALSLFDNQLSLQPCPVISEACQVLWSHFGSALPNVASLAEQCKKLRDALAESPADMRRRHYGSLLNTLSNWVL